MERHGRHLQHACACARRRQLAWLAPVCERGTGAAVFQAVNNHMMQRQHSRASAPFTAASVGRQPVYGADGVRNGAQVRVAGGLRVGVAQAGVPRRRQHLHATLVSVLVSEGKMCSDRRAMAFSWRSRCVLRAGSSGCKLVEISHAQLCLGIGNEQQHGAHLQQRLKTPAVVKHTLRSRLLSSDHFWKCSMQVVFAWHVVLQTPQLQLQLRQSSSRYGAAFSLCRTHNAAHGTRKCRAAAAQGAHAPRQSRADRPSHLPPPCLLPSPFLL